MKLWCESRGGSRGYLCISAAQQQWQPIPEPSKRGSTVPSCLRDFHTPHRGKRTNRRSCCPASELLVEELHPAESWLYRRVADMAVPDAPRRGIQRGMVTYTEPDGGGNCTLAPVERLFQL